MRYLLSFVTFLLLLVAGFQITPVGAVVRAVSGEAQYGALIMPKAPIDKIQKSLLTKKIKAKKAELTTLDVSIKYVEKKIELAKKMGKNTLIFEKKLKALQTSKKLHEAELILLEKKLADIQ